MGFRDSRQQSLAGVLIVLVLVGVGWQFLKWWTLPPAVEFDNLKYIQLLTTAVSSKSADMVDKVETAVHRRVEEGQMSEQEWKHFQRLIARTREGQWEEARRGCFEFAQAQANRARARPAGGTHTHHSQH